MKPTRSLALACLGRFQDVGCRVLALAWILQSAYNGHIITWSLGRVRGGFRVNRLRCGEIAQQATAG